MREYQFIRIIHFLHPEVCLSGDGWVQGSKSALGCVVRCSSSPDCVAVLYKQDIRQCQFFSGSFTVIPSVGCKCYQRVSIMYNSS